MCNMLDFTAMDTFFAASDQLSCYLFQGLPLDGLRPAW